MYKLILIESWINGRRMRKTISKTKKKKMLNNIIIINNNINYDR